VRGVDDAVLDRYLRLPVTKANGVLSGPGFVRAVARVAERLRTRALPAQSEAVRAAMHELSVRWGDLAAGNHFARVVPIDSQGLWGIASPFRALHVVDLAGDRGEWSDAGGAWVSAGSTVLAVSGVTGLEVRLDGQPVEGPVRVGVPGDHVLRLAMSSRPDAFTEVRVRIIVPRASVTLGAGEGRRALVLRLSDGTDRPIDIDAESLEVQGAWRAVGRFVRKEPGTYTVDVEPHAGTLATALRVSANGLVLASPTP